MLMQQLAAAAIPTQQQGYSNLITAVVAPFSAQQFSANQQQSGLNKTAHDCVAKQPADCLWLEI